MIIARSPLRISLGGGGTDLPSYYRRHGGFLIAAAIDKHVYISVHQTFVQELVLKYSKIEQVPHRDQVQHPIIREALKLADISEPNIEIVSMADIPAGTGLGSSGSFTTALLKALFNLRKQPLQPRDLAAQAYHLEHDLLNEPIGKQDPYIAAYGGITCFRFLNNDSVETWPLKISAAFLKELQERLLLFFTGYSRSASTLLKEQDDKSKKDDPSMLQNLHFIKELGLESQKALESGNLREFARLMNVHWEHKKERSSVMSNNKIDEMHSLGLANGALAGKVIGAGGGGFLMFYSEEQERLRQAMRRANIGELRFRFDFEGTKTIAP
ncbi:MAG: galactokinase [Elusimicrobiota bacterium]